MLHSVVRTQCLKGRNDTEFESVTSDIYTSDVFWRSAADWVQVVEVEEQEKLGQRFLLSGQVANFEVFCKNNSECV